MNLEGNIPRVLIGCPAINGGRKLPAIWNQDTHSVLRDSKLRTLPPHQLRRAGLLVGEGEDGSRGGHGQPAEPFAARMTGLLWCGFFAGLLFHYSIVRLLQIWR